MLKILKQKNGMVLALAVILIMASIIIIMTMAAYSFSNYLSVKSVETKSNIYYVADYGMDKTLKNIEIITEEAKSYATEKMFSKDGLAQSAYEGIINAEEIQNPSLTDEERSVLIDIKFKTLMTLFYIEYMNGITDSDNTTGLKKLEQDLADYTLLDPNNANSLLSPLKYKISFEPLEGPYLSTDNILKINVFGSRFKGEKVQFERQIYAEVYLQPWTNDEMKILMPGEGSNFQNSIINEDTVNSETPNETQSKQEKTYKILKWKTVK